MIVHYQLPPTDNVYMKQNTFHTRPFNVRKPLMYIHKLPISTKFLRTLLRKTNPFLYKTSHLLIGKEGQMDKPLKYGIYNATNQNIFSWTFKNQRHTF